MRRLLSLLRAKVAGARRPRAYRPEVGGLEGRQLLTTAVVSATASPPILNPPFNNLVTVTVSGEIDESSDKVTPNTSFQVIDDYRTIQPQGKIDLNKIGPYSYLYSFDITLQAKRINEYPAGRHYYVLVKSADSQNAVGKYVPVLVPHDRLPFGTTTVPSTVEKVPTPKPKTVKAASVKHVSTRTVKVSTTTTHSNSLLGGLF